MTTQKIKQLCIKFHKEVGLHRTVKIYILEGDTNNMTAWFTGKIDEKVWRDIVENSAKRVKKPKPFAKEAKGEGIEYSYICLKKV